MKSQDSQQITGHLEITSTCNKLFEKEDDEISQKIKNQSYIITFQ